MTSLHRREFFAILSACAASEPTLFATPDSTRYQPQALTQVEYDLLDALAETLLPADETGPGAHDARVAYYIDVVLKHSTSAKTQFWKNGLAAVEVLGQSRFQRPFAAGSVGGTGGVDGGVSQRGVGTADRPRSFFRGLQENGN